MKKGKLSTTLICIAWIGFLFISTIMIVQAAVPQYLSFQGKLLEDGNAVTGNRTITFSIWDNSSGGDPASALWHETQVVQIKDGIYNVQLGAITSLPGDLHTYNDLYLQVDAIHPTQGSQTLSPLMPFNSNMFALKAAEADHATDSDSADVALNLVCSGCVSPGELSFTPGDITSVAAGTGLTGGGTSGPVTLNVDTSAIQNRVSGTCAPGSSIRVINQNGTVSCETDMDTDTTYSSGSGLDLVGTTFSVNTSVTQSRVGGTCPVGASIRVINQNGTVECEVDTDTDTNTTYSAGPGLVLKDTTFLVDSSVTQTRVGGTCPVGASIRTINQDGTVECEVDDVGSLTLPYSSWLTSDQAAFWITNHGESGTAIWGLSSANYGNGVFGQTDADIGVGVLGKHQKSGNYAELGVANAAVHAVGVGSSIGVYAQGATAGVFDGNMYAMGNVGIGTQSPTDKLHVVGNLKVVGNDGWNENGDEAILGLGNVLGHFYVKAVYGDGLQLGAYAAPPNSFVLKQLSGNVGIGTGNPSQKLTVDGNVLVQNGSLTTDVLHITGGADLSELFDIRKARTGLEPEPGMVVVIDSENPGLLHVSDRPYDRRVAGIISGGGDVKPGMLMGQKDSKADGATPVALSGRVFCWADASNGSIEAGDLLTTSERPGHVMKVTDYTKAQGAIIGKAMTGLIEGRGQILVLVTLQ